MSKMSIYALSGKIFGQKSASVKSLTNFMSVVVVHHDLILDRD